MDKIGKKLALVGRNTEAEEMEVPEVDQEPGQMDRVRERKR